MIFTAISIIWYYFGGRYRKRERLRRAKKKIVNFLLEKWPGWNSQPAGTICSWIQPLSSCLLNTYCMTKRSRHHKHKKTKTEPVKGMVCVLREFPTAVQFSGKTDKNVSIAPKWALIAFVQVLGNPGEESSQSYVADTRSRAKARTSWDGFLDQLLEVNRSRVFTLEHYLPPRPKESWSSPRNTLFFQKTTCSKVWLHPPPEYALGGLTSVSGDSVSLSSGCGDSC